MKYARYTGMLVLVYLGVVIAFEAFVSAAGGPLKITNVGGPVVVLTLVNADGSTYERILGRIDIKDDIYVATNHWPRSWYSHAIKYPDIQVTFDDGKEEYLAVIATKREHELVDEFYRLPLIIRMLSGFPPRSILKLQPK